MLKDCGDGRYWAYSHCTTKSMSEEQLKAFMEAVKADAGLQEKLNAAADADAVALIAKEMGFVISAEDLQRSQGQETEISEEELEGISGGLRTNLTCGNFCQFFTHPKNSCEAPG